MTSPAGSEALSRAITARDYFRRSTSPLGGQQGHKEWLHFAIYGPGIDVLLNFSLVDDIRPRAPRGAELARITCLLHMDEWDGDVDQWPAETVRVSGGAIDVHFGPNHVVFADGVFHLKASLRNKPVDIELVLEPEAFPSEANNISVEDGPPIHWMVLPRLRASGVIRASGRTIPLVDARAYHDHNWGYFGWGRNFAWEWAYALPFEAASPWSLVFVRLSDRGHRRALMQAMFLWRDERQYRVLRDGEVTVRHDGLLRAQRPFKLPRAMALVSPGTAADVPKTLHVHGSAGGDWLTYEFESEAVAQVIIPNDEDLGVTIINEVSGECSLRGSVRGERIEIRGRSVCEFLGA